MCSTWLLAVFGAMPSSSAISALVMPSATEPRDLELARRQRAPRLVVRGVAAGHPQELVGPVRQQRDAERSAARPDPPRAATASAKRFERTRHVGQIEPGPGRLPRPTVAVPAIDRRLECERARRRSRRLRADQAPPMVERRAGDIRDPLERARHVVQPGRGLGRPSGLMRRPDAGHHEWREQDALTDRRARATRRDTGRTPGRGRRPGGRPRPGPTAAAG